MRVDKRTKLAATMRAVLGRTHKRSRTEPAWASVSLQFDNAAIKLESSQRNW